MMKIVRKIIPCLLVLAGLLLPVSFTGSETKTNYLAPADFCIDKRSNNIYVIQQSKKRIDIVDRKKKTILKSLKLDLPPKSIIQNGSDLLVVSSYSEGELLIVDNKKLKPKKRIQVGKGASDIVLSPDKNYAYISNPFSNDVSFVNLKSGQEETRVRVLRQPMVLEISNDGRYLFVANFLTDSRADIDTVTSKISVIDTELQKKIKDIALANGSNALRGIAKSTDGRFIFISHNLGRFLVPTSQLEHGWMNTSAMSVIDAEKAERVATVLLDEPDKGAAGAWGIDCNDEYIAIAHSGTHEISLIDYPAFITKLIAHPQKENLEYDLQFLTGLRKRIAIKGNGPRAVKLEAKNIWLANYFSDNLNRIPTSELSVNTVIELNRDMKVDEARLGEMYFHDATYCFQQWQACTGCHPNNGRTDGLIWDLLNDGIGNPKNCKSLVISHETPPAMITGIRPSAEVAVRAGFKYIQFSEIDEKKAKAVDAYLKSLQPVPSPYLVDGALSDRAVKGKQVFTERNCMRCHPPPYYTDLKKHKMGVQGEFDHQNTWDTPTLVEVWRTGPYLHDGRSASMEEVFSKEKHGIRGEMSEEDLDNLVEYVLSL